ncbi:MAG: PQQ-dependent sugar dehydrogenase [Pirellulales bacterium]
MFGVLFANVAFADGDEKSPKNSLGNTKREKAWNDSRFLGVPDKPPAFTLERVFPKLSFRAPISMHRYPELVNGKTRWVVIEQSGKIVSFVADDEVSSADTMIQLNNPPPKFSEWGDGKDKSLNAFSLAFHPNFKNNRYVYICYLVQSGKIHPGGTHIARYQVRDTDPPTIDYDTETTILRCDAGGHNGCTLAFGPDGNLYISIGDLTDPTPPDILKTGQDISDFYASILRIDVDKPSRLSDGTEVAYSIPADNPFVNLPKAKGEVYAYGLRNPWRMSFDNKTGQLWVGDVGWELYEMVYRVRSGSNLGWSIKEGPGDVMPDLKPGPTPIQPADIVLNHADAASVTGGYVYHGRKIPSLQGKYIFGDWITRRYWAASFDEQRVTSLEEIAQTEVKPICFADDHDGELFVLEYIQWDQDGGIYRFKPNPAASDFKPNQFPKRLSQTGLFTKTSSLTPATGVFSYQINSSMWMEGADPEFHIAVPGTDSARVFQNPQNTFDWFNSRVFLPKGSVLAKTYKLDERRIETQICQYEANNDIRFYTYHWSEDQSDAELVPASGASTQVPDGSGNQVKWTFAARSAMQDLSHSVVWQYIRVHRRSVKETSIFNGFLARTTVDRRATLRR